MNLENPLIINAELFLQCHGSCRGCFLTELERLEENNYLKNIKVPILKEIQKYKSYSHIIIGFGRGNLLNLTDVALSELASFIKECEEIVPKEKLTFEISSSLIGKIDSQIEKALSLIKKNKNIYFNIVVNSEITSNSFWLNWNKFYTALENERKSWGLQDNLGDILVLNINPKILPDVDFIEKIFKNKKSPINISLFPFSENKIVNEDLEKLNSWAKLMFKKFKDNDLNIKNFLQSLKSINIGESIEDLINFHNKSESAYVFIDKNGKTVKGSLSIMGEVDYVRLLEKFRTSVDIKSAIKLMQKTKPCNLCNYQKECIMSGAYLNMVTNSQKIENPKQCLSGYQEIFSESAL